MSATNRGGERVALDAYYTPDDVAARCVAALPLDAVDLCARWALEPSVGGGAFVRALRTRSPGAHIVGVDIDPAAAGLALCRAGVVGDFATIAADYVEREPSPWLVLGNPPYRDAEAHIRHALGLVLPGGYVAFLLRLAMLESAKRRPLWAEHPPISVHVLSARPSFTGGDTDSAPYGWFVWRRGYTGAPTLGWL